MIFCHENAGSIIILFKFKQKDLGHRLEYLESYYKYVGCNILAVAYRGFDESQGKPT